MNVTDPKIGNPFYPNMIDEQDAVSIRQSIAWPIVVMLNHEMELYIARIKSRDAHNANNANAPLSFDMVDRQGFNALSIRMYTDVKGDKKIQLVSVLSSDKENTSHANSENVILFDTNNIRYALNKIRKNLKESNISNEQADSLAWVRNRGWWMIPKIMHSLFSRYTGHADRQYLRPHHWSAISNTVEYMNKLALGLITELEIPIEIQNDIKYIYKQYTDGVAEKAKILESTKQLFDREKWVIGWVGNNREVVVGSVNTSKLTHGVSNMMDGIADSQDNMFGGMTPDVPFRLFKSIEHIDGDYKDSIMASMTFNKYAIGAVNGVSFMDQTKLIPIVSSNPIPYIPFPEINSFVMRRATSNWSWYIFDRK